MSDFLKGLGNSLGGALNVLSGGGLLDALGNVVGLPPLVTNALKTVAGAVTGNVMLVASGAMGLAQELERNQAAYTEYVTPKDDKVAREGYAKPEERRPAREPSPVVRESRGSPAPGEVRPGGVLDPSILSYRDALRTLEANFTLFDTVDGVKNGQFTRKTLEKVAGNADLPAPVQEAARFLLAHPEYRTQLDTASQKGGVVDGTFNTKDVRAALSDVNARIAQHGVREGSGPTPPGCGRNPGAPAKPPSTGCGSAGSSVRGIINDPDMSLEDKIEAILMNLTQKMDDEILETMDDLAAAQDQRAGISSERGNEKKLAEADRSIERINLRLQKLIEKRKLMFEMMSTLSMKFNEMAKTALSNMRSA